MRSFIASAPESAHLRRLAVRVTASASLLAMTIVGFAGTALASPELGC